LNIDLPQKDFSSLGQSSRSFRSQHDGKDYEHGQNFVFEEIDDSPIEDQNKNNFHLNELPIRNEPIEQSHLSNLYAMEISYNADSNENDLEKLNDNCIKLSNQIVKYSKLLQLKNSQIKMLKKKLSENIQKKQTTCYLKRRNNLLKKKLLMDRRQTVSEKLQQDETISNDVKTVISLLIHKR
jgi:hypothetical protein